MHAKLASFRRTFSLLLFLAFFIFSFFVAGYAHAQTLTLAQLPYRDPRALDALLALDESRFAATITTSWPQVQNTLARYIPPDVIIDQPSFFFASNGTLCLSAHQPVACRVYIDFLAYLMRSKQPPAVAAAPLPVLMRPAQLPWRDTAILNAMLALDSAQLQSALTDHWLWVHQIITRFLPDHVDLHPISKVFTSVRAACNSGHTEVACREFLLQIDSLADSNRRQPRAVFLTLAQIPYRDPAPLDNLLRLNESQLRTRLTSNWPQIDRLLNQYVAWNVALVGAVDFARSRLDCQAWMPGDYFMCRMYFKNLATLMRDKSASLSNPRTNPFGQR